MATSIFLFMVFLLISTANLKAVQSRPLDEAHDDGTNVFNIVNYGAVGDGLSDDTEAFKQAWNQVCSSSHPSPVLHLPPGKTFLLRQLSLEGPCKSNTVNFEIMGDIVAPNGPSEWNCDAHDDGTYYCPSWLTFEHVNNLYITGRDGSSTIDGRGKKWWDLPCHKEGCGRLPEMLIVRHSKNVHIRNLNIVNSPKMHLIIFSSTEVHVQNLNIKAPKSSPNTDGLHISHSHDVFVSDSQIGTGDDCISIEDASSNINIDSISCGPGHGISIGGLGGGGNTAMVENVHVRNVDFSGTTNGVRIKTWQGGKGYCRNIVYENIRFRDSVFPIIIDQHYCDRHFKNACQNSHEELSGVKISNVTYSQISGTSDKPTAIKFDCSGTDPCTDIILNDINIPSTKKGKRTSTYCRNVYGRAQGQVIPRVPCLNHQ